MTRDLRVYEKSKDSVARVFERTVARHPNKVCFQFDDQVWTFQEVYKIPLNYMPTHLPEFFETVMITVPAAVGHWEIVQKVCENVYSYTNS